MIRIHWFTAALNAVALLAAVIAPAGSARADAPDYATQVAPVFKKYCSACHNAEDREGQFVVETYARILEGGEHGAVIAPGRSQDSLLVRVLTGKAKPAMPPEDETKPTADEIALLTAWIDAGARGPEGAEPDQTFLVVPKITPRAAVVDPPTALACSPDGSLLAEAHYGTVEIVHRSDRSLLRKLDGHRGRVTSVAFSADGSRLAAAAGEPGLVGEVRLWNVADGSLIRTFTGHRDSLYAVALSPDGALLATGSYDQQIKLWDVATGAELRTLVGHNDAVYDLAFRPDGRVLASASGDRTVKLWDVASGVRLDTLSQSLKELYTVAFSPDGKQVVAGGVDNRIRVWNVSADAKENTNPLMISRFAHEAAILELVFSRDGHTLVSAGEDKLIQIWDAPALTLRGTLEAQPDWPAALAISPDSASLYVSRLDGSEAEYPLARREAGEAQAAPLSELEPIAWYGEQPPVAALPRAAEIEPNDLPGAATPLAVPGVATGRIEPAAGQPADADLFRFEAKAGERWIIETMAPAEGAAKEHPVDSKIEVLSADGRPVERLLLQAVRDSELEFRSADSAQRGMRLANYEEIDLNDLIYMEGEVIKQFQQRRGPDADADFYPEGGARFAYFDTTGKTHALASKAYVVEAFPLSARLAYNGLPVFRLRYENDDDGERRLGTFSHLTFTAPADGSYLVRVTDVRGFGGPTMGYQLVVRRPQPDFSVSMSPKNPTVAAGSGTRLDLTVDRKDGFWGEVRVDVAGLPPGFYVSSPIVIEAGQRTARGVLAAHPNAPPLTEANAQAARIRASAIIGGAEVLKPSGDLGKIVLGPKPQVLVHLAPPGQSPRLPTGDAASSLDFPAPAELTIAPGTTITFLLSIERNGQNGIINFDVDNLPFGVIVDNIGLNGIQLLEGQTERTLFLSATREVPEQDRLFQLRASADNGQVSLPLLLHVRRGAAVAANDTAGK
ncbi:MAG TPA: c-type cytochrome domain-containing protein [Pirellulales bacterium]|nr:c-type cytochrome domain-containing protein [Pirellulales bacterium]